MQLIDRTVRLCAAGACALAGFVATAWAQPAEPSKASLDAARIAQILGPAVVPLRNQATLALPANAIFIPLPAATAVLHSMGAAADDKLLGVVLPQGEGSGVVAVQFVGQGYVKSADAKRWKTDGLLKLLKATPPPSAPPSEVTDWAMAPAYDAATASLQWAVSTRIPNAPADAAGVNYNAFALGREGYVRLNMVAGAAQWNQQKAVVQALLPAVQFNETQRYTDYTSGKTAPFGLAVLVGGPGSEKAVSASAAQWLWPIFGVLLVGLLAAGVRWFMQRKAEQKKRERREFEETSQATQFQETKQGSFLGDIGDLPTAPAELPR